MRRVTIVGGSLAGLRAAQSLRREGFDGAIRIVSAEEHLPVDRPPLSKQVLAGAWSSSKAELRGVEEAAADWILGRSAVGLDVASLDVTLDDGSVVDADGVVIACGATPRQIPSLEGALELRTLADCMALQGALSAGARVVVVGAGFIGSEVASTARSLGLEVTVLEMLPIPLSRILGESMGALCGRLHTDNGVDLRLGVTVSGLAPGGVLLGDGTVVPADVVVVGVGVVPAVDWLSNSGLTIDNGIVCDSRCRAAPGVVAAGDVARWFHPTYGQHVRVEHWTNASEMGTAAALSLLHGDAAPTYNPTPYFWSDQYGTKIQFIGHNSPTDVVAVAEGSVDEGRFVATYSNADKVTAALIWNRPARLPHWMSVLEGS